MLLTPNMQDSTQGTLCSTLYFSPRSRLLSSRLCTCLDPRPTASSRVPQCSLTSKGVFLAQHPFLLGCLGAWPFPSRTMCLDCILSALPRQGSRPCCGKTLYFPRRQPCIC